MKVPRAALGELRRILRTNPSVAGFSETIRKRTRHGKEQEEDVIRIYVIGKKPERSVPKGEILPKEIHGIPVDIVAIGRLTAFQIANRGRFRPLLGGVSCINTHIIGAGTLGYFLRDKRAMHPPQKPQWYILSCAHVLDGGTLGRETQQPANGDGGGSPGDWVGAETLYCYNPVDSALAPIDAGARSVIVGLPTPQGTVRGYNGMTVAKSGRTTGVTYGQIIEDDATLAIRYSATTNRTYRHCLVITNRANNFVRPGDSGSLVIEPVDERAVGMIFAGGSRGGIAFHIADLLRIYPNQVMVAPGESYP
jgi:hypothetical protein